MAVYNSEFCTSRFSLHYIKNLFLKKLYLTHRHLLNTPNNTIQLFNSTCTVQVLGIPAEAGYVQVLCKCNLVLYKDLSSLKVGWPWRCEEECLESIPQDTEGQLYFSVSWRLLFFTFQWSQPKLLSLGTRDPTPATVSPAVGVHS